MSLLHVRRVLNRLSLTDKERLPGASSRSTPSAGPTLPTLIWERVIDLVAEEDFMQFWRAGALKTLQACSLTCRAWTPRSQFYIFRVVSVFCSTRGRKSTKRLAALLTRHPALHARIRVLVVRAGKGDYTSLDRMPQQLAGLLPHLPTVRLSNFFLTPAKGDAFDVSLQQFASVMSLVLDSVTLYSVRDLQRVVSGIPSIQSLQLRFVKWVHTEVADSAASLNTSPLVRLQVFEAQSHAGWLRDGRTLQFLTWLGLSNFSTELTSITLTHAMILNNALLTAVETLIETSKASLRSLALSLGPDVDFVRLSTVLSRCKRLTTLTLSIPSHSTAFARLVSLLISTDIPTCAALSLLLYEFPAAPWFTPTTDHWRTLDDVLQMPQWQRLPAVYFHRVHVKLSHSRQMIVWGDVYGKLPFDEVDVCRRLRVDLPRLYKAKKLWYLHGEKGGFRLLEN